MQNPWLNPPSSGLTESRKDIKAASQSLTVDEIRYLVQSYYQVQEFRKAASNMRLALSKDEKPHELVGWLSDSQSRIEEDIKISLFVYASNDPTGKWLMSIHGIGEVLAAGLLAEVPIDKTPTAGDLWSFAGLNPDQEWGKGEKRPWNADLKVLAWKCGESFIKTCNSPKSFYGPIYAARKEKEIKLNERGAFSDQAAKVLETKNIQAKETRAHYEGGRLPPAHIHSRARRFAVKLFLSHFHDVFMYHETGRRAPMPYAFSHLEEEHVHYIECPNPPWEERGLDGLRKTDVRQLSEVDPSAA